MESLSPPVSGSDPNSINIPDDVYDSLLAEVWSLFRNIDGVADKPPPLSERLPRRGGHPETLQEYVDAHHPLWTRIRQLMADKTVSRRRLVEFIRKEWGGQSVNPLADLSYLPTSASTNANGSNRHDETETESRTERQRVLANENQRLEMLKNKRSQFREAQRMQRKRKLDEQSSSSDPRPTDSVSKEECESKFLNLAHKNKVNPDAAALGLMNIEELFNLKSAYSNDNNQTIRISNEEMNNFLASEFFFLIKVARSYGDPFNEDKEADRPETENSEAENPTGLWHQDNFDESMMLYF